MLISTQEEHNFFWIVLLSVSHILSCTEMIIYVESGFVLSAG